MKIGIVIGSIREGRLGEQVATWVADQAAGTDGVEIEIIDLKSFNVPLFTGKTLPAMANRQYESAEVTAWSAAIDSCDAYIFVTAEYNHGVPGAFKNAVDSLGPEWTGKTVAFVSYGADNGVRAVEQWRQIIANFEMFDVRAQVSLGLFTEFDESGLKRSERRDGEIVNLLTQLVDLTRRVS